MAKLAPILIAIALCGCEDEPSSSADTTTTPDTSAPTLCSKYGGAAAVDAVVQGHIVPAIAGDCRINSFFTSLSADGLSHVAECLSIQVQGMFGCPGVTYAGSRDARGVPCRDMVEAHVGLQLSQGDFDALIEDVVAGLTAAGVEEADINAAAPALLGMQSAIVAQPEYADPSHGLCE